MYKKSQDFYNIPISFSIIFLTFVDYFFKWKTDNMKKFTNHFSVWSVKDEKYL